MVSVLFLFEDFRYIAAVTSRAIMAREIPEVVVSTMEALVKCGVVMVSIALAYHQVVIQYNWKRGVGWTEAPKGSIPLDEFVPGAARQVRPNDAARLGCRLEDFGRHWTEEPATPRHRANIVHMLKARAWHLAARQVRPGNA